MEKKRTNLNTKIMLLITLGMLLPLVWNPGFIATVSAATPSITSIQGTFTHGQSVTISGSGFGAKTTAAPFVWDNFESGIIGNNIDGTSPVFGPIWNYYSGHPVYTNTNQRTNSAKSALMDFTDAHPGYNECSLSFNKVTDTAYFTFWWRLNIVNNSWTRNIKPYYAYGNAGSPGQPLSATGFNYDSYENSMIPTIGNVDLFESLTYPPENYGWDDLYGSTNLVNAETHWLRFEFYLKLNTPPRIMDGMHQMWVQNPDSGNPVLLDLNGDGIINRLTSNLYRNWNIVSTFARDGSTPNAEGQIRVDDMYFDTTQARVEIGDAPVYTDCTHREIQIPSAWDSGHITITVNPGTFNGGEHAYLFVVDETGTPNEQGYPITFGGQVSDTTPPAAVSTLAVASRRQTSVLLTWTAVGDDGNSGTAIAYDIRYSTVPITTNNWESAIQVSGEPVPKAAGQVETFHIKGLVPGSMYYFALKAADEVPNWSILSNIPSIRTSTFFGFLP